MIPLPLAVVAELDVAADVNHPIVTTVSIGAVAIVMLFFSVWLMEKLTPFSIRKEIEEDQNVALGIIIGAVMISLGIIVAAGIHS